MKQNTNLAREKTKEEEGKKNDVDDGHGFLNQDFQRLENIGKSN